MKNIIKTALSFFLLATISVSAQQASRNTVLSYADSLAKRVLEYEGLHTVYSGLKPISTVKHVEFAIDSVTAEFTAPEKVKEELEFIRKSLELLENDNIGYILLPFKSVYGNTRTYEILVYNRKSVAELIKGKSGFFLKRGITPSVSPEILLTLYEFEDKTDRFRAYGYLFGYPDHAVDFFVEASKTNVEKGEFVERDFYQLPVASGEDGRFVYAVPKGHIPNDIDLEIKEKAAENVEEYLELKERVNIEESQYPYLDLLLSFIP
ncbi:hypothetical protein [Sinomicrobium soli]|uniref:hypothetical protein n=1 Tax=Sinomicrobium sp. N-1-3-6 TaxID=2219864 RepID=UPI000DCD740B|nr:hypothetical protein [Sinomicrobium sp. N-1-3-6]RAV28970.1 hypothetical protein DN748_11315 [Sinomicrobium sp. N-1-3-6]